MPFKTSGTTAAELILQLARSVVSGDALRARSIAMELAEHDLSMTLLPVGLSALELTVAGALIDLLATRTGQHSPHWSGDVQPSATPYFLVRSAERMPNLRRQCEAETPDVLRRRNLFAPANYLTWV